MQFVSLWRQDLSTALLGDMATQEVEEITKYTGASMGQALTMPTSSLPDQTAEPPLFSKDTLYHASMCCYIVNIYNDLNYKHHLNSTSHQFEEVSMSIRGMQKAYVERYMIAKHSNDTYFVAFRVDDALSVWTRMYASFSDGK